MMYGWTDLMGTILSDLKRGSELAKRSLLATVAQPENCCCVSNSAFITTGCIWLRATNEVAHLSAT